MPKAKHGNFTLKRILQGCPADKAAHRMTALQRSGQYSELRFIQRGKGAFDIVGYKWPDKGARRKLGIGRSKNPSPAHGATPNQVTFGSRGKVKVGWISRKTPTMYEVTYKDGASTKTVMRKKNKVTFTASKKRGTLKKNPCLKTANPAIETRRAVELSKLFHGFDPRKIKAVNIKWPGSLTALGACVRIDYACDKWDGKDRIYFHDFVRPAVVYAAPSPQADGSNILIVHGKFKITKAGIEG